jgi:hypothetical protein
LGSTFQQKTRNSFGFAGFLFWALDQARASDHPFAHRHDVQGLRRDEQLNPATRIHLKPPQ